MYLTTFIAPYLAPGLHVLFSSHVLIQNPRESGLLGGLPPLPAFLRTGSRRSRCVGVLGRRTSSRQHGRQLLVGVLQPGSLARIRPLGVEVADDRHGRGEHGLEGRRDEVARRIEPLGERPGELDGLGLAGLGGDGDGEVVDGDVLFGVGCYRDLVCRYH